MNLDTKYQSSWLPDYFVPKYLSTKYLNTWEDFFFFLYFFYLITKPQLEFKFSDLTKALLEGNQGYTKGRPRLS